MSELRQRRGEEDEDSPGDRKTVKEIHQTATSIKYTEGKYDDLYMSGGANFKKQELEDIIRMSVNPKPQSKKDQKSMTNATKAVKDELDDDPYNIKLINALGCKYFQDFEWSMCCNTMMRGWKRASEITDAKEQYSFLMKLCEASFRNHNFKQAHAVLMDIQEPDDGYERKAYLLLACQIHGEMKDAQKTLASFSKAIEGEAFEVAIGLWAACALALRKVGVFPSTTTTMNSKVRSGATHHMDQERMKVVESWSVMSQSGEEENQQSMISLTFEGKPPKKVIQAGIALLVFLMLWLFYIMEQRSLKKHNLAK